MRLLRRLLAALRWDDACRCARDASTFRYLEAVKPASPKPHRTIEDMLRTARMYEELERMDGWRDFLARIGALRQQFVDELLTGRYRQRPARRLTITELQAMIFAMDNALSIPALAKEAFEGWRKAQEEQMKAAGKLEARQEP